MARWPHLSDVIPKIKMIADGSDIICPLELDDQSDDPAACLPTEESVRT
jgi:hypothetical protein